MTNLIRMPRTASTADRFLLPRTAAEFFNRYPHEVHTLLLMNCEDKLVQVGQGQMLVKAALRPDEILLYTAQINHELATGPWISKYAELMDGRASAKEFFAEVRALIFALLKELRTAH